MVEYRMRKNVGVQIYTDEEGVQRPVKIAYTNRAGDLHIFTIAKILDVRQAASTKVGAIGDRYTIVIEGHQDSRYLFYENPVWFIEEIVSKEEYEAYEAKEREKYEGSDWQGAR